MLICFEGVDGSGKNTQTTRVVEEARKRPAFTAVRSLSFPDYAGPSGALVGRLLRGETQVVTQDTDEHGWSMDKALLVQMAQAASRYEWQWLLREYLAKDKLLVLDRYRLSGVVYGHADGIPTAWTYSIQQDMVQPHWTFIIDVSVEESMRRRPHRRDYYERNEKKLNTVREAYRTASSTLPQHTLLDGSVAEDVLTKQIVTKLEELGIF